jgi:membrane protease YdiL (CAAX protease family)
MRSALRVSRTIKATLSLTSKQERHNMIAIGDYIRERELLAFFVLAFAISWVGIAAVIGGPGEFFGATAQQVEAKFLRVLMAWLAGPSVSCLAMTALADGGAGLRDLWARLTMCRPEDRRWYALALLLAPLMFATVALTLSRAISTAFLPGMLVAEDKGSLVAMALAYGVIGGGFLEELGWTGFAVPKFRQHFDVFDTGIMLGLLWGAYHFSVVFWSTQPTGALEVGLILPLQLFAWLTPYRVLMVWVYDTTNSLPVAMVMHASLTAGMLMFQPANMAGTVLLTWLVAWAASWWAIVAAWAGLVNRRAKIAPQTGQALRTKNA